MTVENFVLLNRGLLKNYPHDETWNLDKFKKEFSVSLVSYKHGSDTIEIDFRCINATFANAIRRAITAEVPTIAFDRIYFHQNSGIMADEILALRIGLLPLNIPPDYLEYSKSFPETDKLEDFNEKQHIIFDLDVKNIKSKSSESVARRSVISEDFTHIPIGSQKKDFSVTPRMQHDKILLTKLGLGDEIKARCIAVKGIGRDHAKFEPISTCYYKFHPTIKLNQEFDGELALKLKDSFPKGVIDINPKTGVAFVNNVRLENGSREFLRHEEFRNGQVEVIIDPNHCIFYVESLVPESRSPDILVKEAIEIMIEKADYYINVIKNMDFLKNLSVDISSSSDDEFFSSFPLKSTPAFLCGREVQFEITNISRDLQNGTFKFIGEDHTLGGALRYCILKLPCEPFCGYCVPHPLEDNIIVNIQNGPGSPIQKSLLDGLELLRDSFNHILSCYETCLSSIEMK